MKKFFLINAFSNYGPILIIISSVLWALDGLFRRSLYLLPPITIVFLEHFIGSIILLPFFFQALPEIKKLIQNKEKLKKIVFPLLFIALFGGLLGTLWFTSALAQVNYIPFSVVFLLQKLQPIFVIASASILLNEKITKDYFKWAGMAIISAYFVTFPNGKAVLSVESGVLIAVLYSIGAAFAWGISTTFSKMLLKNISSRLGTILRFFTTSLFAFIGLIFIRKIDSVASVGVFQVIILIAIALSTGVVAMLLYYKGLKKTSAKVSTILELAFPLTAVFIDAVVYKTYLTVSQYFASILLFYAIYRVGRLNQK